MGLPITERFADEILLLEEELALLRAVLVEVADGLERSAGQDITARYSAKLRSAAAHSRSDAGKPKEGPVT